MTPAKENAPGFLENGSWHGMIGEIQRNVNTILSKIPAFKAKFLKFKYKSGSGYFAGPIRPVPGTLPGERLRRLCRRKWIHFADQVSHSWHIQLGRS